MTRPDDSDARRKRYADDNELADAIDAWHRGDRQDLALHAYLGWTVREYERWLVTGTTPPRETPPPRDAPGRDEGAPVGAPSSTAGGVGSSGPSA